MSKIFTINEFNAISKGEVFATGIVIDAHSGCDMTSSGEELKFIAVKGYVEDWAVYVMWNRPQNDDTLIRHMGDKVKTPRNIKACVPCDDEMLARYRR